MLGEPLIAITMGTRPYAAVLCKLWGCADDKQRTPTSVTTQSRQGNIDAAELFSAPSGLDEHDEVR